MSKRDFSANRYFNSSELKWGSVEEISEVSLQWGLGPWESSLRRIISYPILKITTGQKDKSQFGELGSSIASDQRTPEDEIRYRANR